MWAVFVLLHKYFTNDVVSLCTFSHLLIRLSEGGWARSSTAEFYRTQMLVCVAADEYELLAVSEGGALLLSAVTPGCLWSSPGVQIPLWGEAISSLTALSLVQRETNSCRKTGREEGLKERRMDWRKGGWIEGREEGLKEGGRDWRKGGGIKGREEGLQVGLQRADHHVLYSACRCFQSCSLLLSLPFVGSVVL